MIHRTTVINSQQAYLTTYSSHSSIALFLHSEQESIQINFQIEHISILQQVIQQLLQLQSQQIRTRAKKLQQELNAIILDSNPKF